MKIRTQEVLSDRMAGDLGWRKKELTDIRQLAQLAKHHPRERALTRSGVALLYAHFEGFTRQAARAYLEYVASLRLQNGELAKNLVAVSLADLLSSVAGSKRASAYQRAVDFFLDGGGRRAHIPYKTAIDTESNLSSKVFREIIFVLGLDYGPYEAKEKLIDSRLLARRNHIAHGEFVELDHADYDELHDSVIEIMNCLRNQIENAVAVGSYVRAPAHGGVPNGA